jgi:hypothetical protein
VANDAGNLDEAQALLARAEAIYRAAGAGSRAELATTRIDQVAVLRRQSRHQEAEAIAREVLALRLELFGRRHVAVAEALNVLANIARRAGRLDDAEKLAEEALLLRSELLPPGHPQRVGNRADLALIKDAKRDYAGAAALHALVIEELQQARGERHPELAVALYSHSKSLRRLRRYDEAEAALLRARDIARASFGERHTTLAFVLNDLGVLAHTRQREVQARDYFEQALAAMPDSHAWWRPSVLRSLGMVEMAAGNPSRALSLFIDARERLRQGGRYANDILELATSIAEAQRARGEHAAAEAELRSALAEFAAATDASSSAPDAAHAAALILLGRMLIERRQFADAVASLERSVRIFEQLEDPDRDQANDAAALLVTARAGAR